MRLITKNSRVPGKVPTPEQLLDGELAINIADVKLFAKDINGIVKEIGGSNSGSGSPDADIFRMSLGII